MKYYFIVVDDVKELVELHIKKWKEIFIDQIRPEENVQYDFCGINITEKIDDQWKFDIIKGNSHSSSTMGTEKMAQYIYEIINKYNNGKTLILIDRDWAKIGGDNNSGGRLYELLKVMIGNNNNVECWTTSGFVYGGERLIPRFYNDNEQELDNEIPAPCKVENLLGDKAENENIYKKKLRIYASEKDDFIHYYFTKVFSKIS